MKRPNFFILGGPKCGTTSLAAWLGEHPNVFMSTPKEPRFFDTDYRLVGRMTLAEYENLFACASEQHLWVGEATVRYLRSHVALSRILEFSKDPRFIVCVRNPIEMVVSLHAQLLKTGKETETDFIRAWQLQTPRSRGKHVPFLCEGYNYLLYGSICLLGEQLAYVYDKVAPNRVCVVVLDDVGKNPESEYHRILRFLDLPTDHRIHFPVYNKAYKLSPMVAKSLRTAEIMRNVLRIRKAFHIEKWIMTWIPRILGHPVHQAKLPPLFLAELRDYFRADVKKLSGLLDRDLTGWLTSGTLSSRQ
ncbi:MAG: sulfotransferase domain-containing protein [Gammaproteobacteria bacterium]|nr:sulfotransferase domain-containing protein [Gammaproteobacteria bacterium]NNJ83351.1 sulfotransferase [Gammaproteobacteria bacterium]